MLERKRKEQGNQFFKTYRACLLTLRNALEWLSLKELVESAYDDLFPPRAFLAQRMHRNLDRFLNGNESARGGRVRRRDLRG
jgi:hypothetical protein